MQITRLGRQVGLSWQRSCSAASGWSFEPTANIPAVASVQDTASNPAASPQCHVNPGSSASIGWHRHASHQASSAGPSEPVSSGDFQHHVSSPGSTVDPSSKSHVSAGPPCSNLPHPGFTRSSNSSSILRSPHPTSSIQAAVSRPSAASIQTHSSPCFLPLPTTPASQTTLTAATSILNVHPKAVSNPQPPHTRNLATKRTPPTRKRPIMLGDTTPGTRPDARRLVAPDCRFLLTYKKTIPHPQLTYRLAKRSEVTDIRDMVALYSHQMDIVSVATALARLSAAQRAATANSTLTPEFLAASADTLARLHARLEEQIQWGALAPISAVMWSLSQLQAPLSTPPELALALLTKAVSSRTKMVVGQPHRLSVMAWALPRLLPKELHSDPRVVTALDRIALIALKNISKFSPQSINLGADMLARALPEGRERRLAEHVRRSSERIAELISNIMDFARGKLGDGLAVTLEPGVELAADLEHVISEIQIAHPERRIDASISLPFTTPCDGKRIAQMLGNLVANAVVHGSQTAPIKTRSDGCSSRLPAAPPARLNRVSALACTSPRKLRAHTVAPSPPRRTP
ncbi:MAG: hypothetical protein WDW38_007638 [Sanguina aurantia]